MPRQKCFRQNAYLCAPFKQKKTMISRICSFLKVLLVGLLLAGCQTTPKTDIGKIEALKKQLKTDAKTLEQIKANEFATLERDFTICDSLLQYMHPEAMDEAFQELQLTKAYLDQFKTTQPSILANIDSTLYRLDCLSNDISTHYISDSLTTIYLEEETQYVELLSNQVNYFKDRFSSCQNELNVLKGKK